MQLDFEASSLIFLLIASPFVGSFLALVIERLPVGKTVFFGRSCCQGCERVLGAVDMVPLVSALFLRWRCRTCRRAFGKRDSLVELLSLGLAIWCVLVLPVPVIFVGFMLGSVLLVLSAIDMEHMYLPDVLVYPLILGGLVFVWWWQPDAFIHHILGAGIGGLSFYLIRWCYTRFRGYEGLGLGDVKFACGIGAWVGWMGLASVILIAAVSGLIFYLTRKNIKGDPMAPREEARLYEEEAIPENEILPFGPFLSFGLWITWLYGPITMG
ncbi:prepilin peptidase [Kiloniella majae]|uniref:prepilin peptidase n=1 Tax=Kiloniella majae TaxID=1938558 RepID=UPI000A277CE9|nr:A24 family peptidase [Kiloniella majae]